MRSSQRIAPGSRVVYVDIDPVAVAESLDILDGNEHSTAVLGDLLAPQAILDNPQVREVLDFEPADRAAADGDPAFRAR